MTTTDLEKELKRLHKRLNRFHLDWVTRLVLADVYEEMGDLVRSKFQKWLVKNKKAPKPMHREGWLRGTIKGQRWNWFRSAQGRKDFYTLHSLFDELGLLGKAYSEGMHGYHPDTISREKAEEHLLHKILMYKPLLLDKV